MLPMDGKRLISVTAADRHAASAEGSHRSDDVDRAQLMVVVLFFSGVQLIAMGVIGEYVGRIFVKARAARSICWMPTLPHAL